MTGYLESQSTIVDSPMDRYEARALIDTIKRDVARSWDNLQEVYRRRGHEALGYDSFAECLRVEFDVGRSRSYQLVGSFRVVAEIEAESTTVDSALPANERVARELTRVDDPAEVWRDVVELNGDQPTAKQTRAVVQERRELKDPATAKQLAYLRKLGDSPPDRPVSKQWASKRIEELQRHRYCTCATCGQHWDREKGRRL